MVMDCSSRCKAGPQLLLVLAAGVPSLGTRFSGDDACERRGTSSTGKASETFSRGFCILVGASC